MKPWDSYSIGTISNHCKLHLQYNILKYKESSDKYSQNTPISTKHNGADIR